PRPDVAQRIEHQSSELRVGGSNPFVRANLFLRSTISTVEPILLGLSLCLVVVCLACPRLIFLLDIW
ncbi:MAG: hypothetical protein RLZ87_519, partial [Armatimonadota bacterium]